MTHRTDDIHDATERPATNRRSIVLDDTVEIDVPLPDVFAHLIDVSSDPEWQAGVVEAAYTSPGPIGVGTTGVHRARPMGLNVEVGWRLTHFDEPTHLAWTFISGPFTGNESYSLAPTAAGATRLVHTATLYPRGLFRILRPLIGPAFVKQSQEALECLKQLLESRQPALADEPGQP